MNYLRNLSQNELGQAKDQDIRGCESKMWTTGGEEIEIRVQCHRFEEDNSFYVVVYQVHGDSAPQTLYGFSLDQADLNHIKIYMDHGDSLVIEGIGDDSGSLVRVPFFWTTH